MKRIKKISALLMAIAMFASVTTACGSDDKEASKSEASKSESSSTTTDDGKELVGNTYVEGLPIAKDPITYTMMNTKGTSDKSATQNEKAIYKYGSTDTNVTIEWTEHSNAGIGEQLNLLLTVGSGLPDGFLATWISDDQIAQNTNCFYELSEDTLSKFAPNIYNGVQEFVPGSLDALRKADGKIYSLPAGTWANYVNEARGVPLINSGWVKELGKEMPTNIDELYDILVAMKNDDPNGNGKNDEIPYVFCAADVNSSIQAMGGSWGIGGRDYHIQDYAGRVIDGEYQFMLNTEAARDWLTEMNKWSEAGLINGDAFTMTQSEYTSLKNQKLQGMYVTWATEDKDNYDGWSPLPVIPAVGYEGKEIKTGENGYRTAAMNGFAISSSCKEPEGLLRWWDNLHTSEEVKMLNTSEQGVLWDVDDAGDVYAIAPTEFPAGITTEVELTFTLGVVNFSPLVFPGEGAKPDLTKTTDTKLRYDYCEFYKDSYPEECIPRTPVPADISEDFAFVKTEMEEYITTFIANAVTKGITDESWDKHLSDLEGYGLQDYIKFYSDYTSGAFYE